MSQELSKAIDETGKEIYETGFQELFGRADDPNVAYLRLRRLLIQYFKLRFPYGDVEDLADQVIERTLLKVREGSAKIENDTSTSRYALGVARNVGFEYLRKKHSEPLVSDLTVTESIETWEEEEKERKRLEVLTSCLQELRPSDRELLLNYYGERRGETKQLAAELGFSHEKLRVHVHRLKQRLRVMIKRRLEDSGRS